MELLYVWIAHYKNIVCQGFSLSPDYDIRFEVPEERTNTFEGTLYFTDRTKSKTNFFGDNITNLTVIVGGNGTGKSNFFRFLLDYALRRVDEELPAAMFIWKVGEKIKIYYPQSEEQTPPAFEIISEKISFDEVEKDVSNIREALWIYYSNFYNTFGIFDGLHYQLDGEINLTTNYLLQSDFGLSSSDDVKGFFVPFGKTLDVHQVREREREAKAVYYFRKKRNGLGVALPFKMPRYLVFRLVFDDEDSINKNPWAELVELKDKLTREETGWRWGEASLEGTRMTLWAAILLAFLKDYYEFKFNVTSNEGVEKDLQRYLLRDGKITDSDVRNFLKSMQTNYTDFYPEWVGEVKNIFSLVDGHLIPYWEKKGEKPTLAVLGKPDFGRELAHNFDTTFYKEEQLMDIIDLYLGSFEWGGYMNLGWKHAAPRDSDEELSNNPSKFNGIADYVTQFSSGEQTQLNIISRFLYAIEKAKKEEDYVNRSHYFILIDEGELTLHPEWQRKFIANLVAMFSQMELDGKTLQIILSTHSPLILSDIPKENTIFLRKNRKTGVTTVVPSSEQPQTFGANIHTLLADSFFLSSLIGEFSLGKINNWIKALNDENWGEYQNKEEELKNNIQTIGEPIIREKLMQMYESKLPEEQRKQSEIARLQARINQLQQNSRTETNEEGDSND